MTERWRPVPGFEGRYEVSDLGNVQSVPRWGTPGGALKPFDRYGYPSVTLRDGDRKETICVHRLVLCAYIGPAPAGMEAAHNNGNRQDSRLANLRWTTKAENTADRTRHGKHRRAMDDRRKLAPEDAAFIRANHKRIKQTDLAAMFGVHRATIQRIHSGERYTLAREGVRNA